MISLKFNYQIQLTMERNEVKCALVLLCLLIVQIYGEATEACQTPKATQGECKIITSCPSLLALLQHRPLKAQGADLLRRSQCGFEGTLPKVCCPLNDGEGLSSAATTMKVTTVENVDSGGNELFPSRDECGVETQDKIYGGEVAGIDEFPWMALIEYDTGDRMHGFHCGGVLINKRYVLTAAHCVKGKDLPKSWKLTGVRMGEYDQDSAVDCTGPPNRRLCAPPPQDIAVEETITHEQYDPYDPNQYNDIALLRLGREANYSAFVKPICTPHEKDMQDKSFVSKKLVVAGWGKTETTSASSIKLKLDVPVKGNTECATRYRQAHVSLRSTQLCAGGEQGRDSCRGDSGGPLMSYEQKGAEQNWYVVGVVSFGPSPCAMENWPGVYTRVGSYIPWLKSKMRR